MPKPYQHALCATCTSTKAERERERVRGGERGRERRVLREETLL